MAGGLYVFQQLCHREIDHVDGIAFGVKCSVFEGDFAIGDGVVIGGLHESVNEDNDRKCIKRGL